MEMKIYIQIIRSKMKAGMLILCSELAHYVRKPWDYAYGSTILIVIDWSREKFQSFNKKKRKYLKTLPKFKAMFDYIYGLLR